MTLTAKVYGNFLKHAVDGIVDLTRLRVCLLTSSYTPNQDTHDFLDDVITYEAEGTGYTPYGVLLDNATATYDAVNHRLVIDCDDEVISDSSVTARYACFYIDIVGEGTDGKPLVCYWDFGTDEQSIAGAFTLTISSDGLVRIPVNST